MKDAEKFSSVQTSTHTLQISRNSSFNKTEVLFLSACITVTFYIIYLTKALGQVQLRGKKTRNKTVLLHLQQSDSGFLSEASVLTATTLASKRWREIKARQLKIFLQIS